MRPECGSELIIIEYDLFRLEICEVREATEPTETWYGRRKLEPGNVDV